MPRGHLKQYKDLVKEAQAKRIQITKNQKKEIEKMYSEVAQDLSKELSRHGKETLSYRWLKDYSNVLKEESKSLYKSIKDTVSKNMLAVSKAEVDIQKSFYSSIAPTLSERFTDVFSTIPQQAVNELLNGGIYKDFTGLSERIWNYKGQFDKDIGYIINKGIIAKKSAYELSKDLEKYLNPNAKKDWDWKKVYPGSREKVDYNAQRLARTSITHAYQLSFQRSTIDNPFVEKYMWNSSNGGRTCELCASRDGKLFEKDEVPLDHPNGMCVITAVINKSYDEIADELADWVNGGDNPSLDKWLGEYEGDIGDKVYKVTHPKLQKQLNAFERQLRLMENQNIKVLLRQSKDGVTIRKSSSARSRYNAAENTVYIAENASNGVIAHELFHEIDLTNSVIINGALAVNLKNDFARIEAGVKDGESIVNMIYSKYPEAFYESERGLRVHEEYRGISDILSGISGGEIYLGYSHDTKYWKKEKKVEAEAWAQAGRIFFDENPNVISMFRDLFPGTFAEIERIIEGLVKKCGMVK